MSEAGATISVWFLKKAGEGSPVRFIGAGDPLEAAAIREVDLQRRFYASATKLAAKPEVTPPTLQALRQQPGIGVDPHRMRVFAFGNSKHPTVRDNAFGLMRNALVATLETMAVPLLAL